MTKKTFFYSAALLLSACFFGACGGDDDDSDGSKNYTTTASIKKSNSVFSSITQESDMILSYWQSGETVAAVLNGSTTKSAGTLSISGSTGSRKADFKGTLKGIFTQSSKFTVYSPASCISGGTITYTYTGQTGVKSKIHNFNFAKGTATIDGFNSNTNPGTMEFNEFELSNVQALCKFTFVDSNNKTLNVGTLKIKSNAGIARVVTDGTATDKGVLTITNGNSDKDDPIFVAIYNTSSSQDTFTFDVTTSDSEAASYTGSTTLTCAPNTYIEKTITLTKE